MTKQTRSFDIYENIEQQFAFYYGVNSTRGQMLLQIKRQESKQPFGSLLKTIALQHFLKFDIGTTPLEALPLVVKNFKHPSGNKSFDVKVIGVLRTDIAKNPDLNQFIY